MNGFVSENLICETVHDPILGGNKNNWVARIN